MLWVSSIAKCHMRVDEAKKHKYDVLRFGCLRFSDAVNKFHFTQESNDIWKK